VQFWQLLWQQKTRGAVLATSVATEDTWCSSGKIRSTQIATRWTSRSITSRVVLAAMAAMGAMALALSSRM
jgi:hypothetical protein